MNCDFTEEVSLLVDGELAPHEAARLGAHVESCAACQRAREAFLLLRQELRSYELSLDSQAQSAALAAILNSRSHAGEAAPTSRELLARLAGSLAEAFSARRLRPAHVAAFALLLIGVLLGVRWFKGPHTAQPSGVPAVASVNTRPVQTTTTADGDNKKSESSTVVNNPPANVQTADHKTVPRPASAAPNVRARSELARFKRDVNRAKRQRPEGLNLDPSLEVARTGETVSNPATAGSVALYAGVSLRAAAADPALRFGRHAERVERLFRSFRNARLAEGDPTLDVADARRLSRRLLYSNIALRREAASAGDLPAEGLLDSVEPILVDISNLSNTPSPDAVGSIKESIRRRQLVGVLHAQGMGASR